MFGSTDKDISQLLESDTGAMMFDDLEILEEYLNGVALPSLEAVVPQALEDGWAETPGFTDDVAAAPAVAEESAGTSFTTSTMAEIYVSQGFIQRAMDIYEEMLTESPLNEGIIQRLSELQDLLSAQSVAAKPAEIPVAVSEFAAPVAETAGEKNVVATLESWLDNINRRR